MKEMTNKYTFYGHDCEDQMISELAEPFRRGRQTFIQFIVYIQPAAYKGSSVSDNRQTVHSIHYTSCLLVDLSSSIDGYVDN